MMMSGIFLRDNVSIVLIAVVELIPEPEEKRKPEPVLEYVKVINFSSQSFNCLYHFLQISVTKRSQIGPGVSCMVFIRFCEERD
jgi:hypothetical protein